MYDSQLNQKNSPQCKMHLAFLVIVGITLTGCAIPGNLVALVQTPTATPLSITDDCTKNTEPTEQDVKYALAFAGNTFDPGSWDRSYTVQSMRVSVTWFSKDKRKVVFLDYLLYNCGFKQSDWDYVLADRTFREIRFQGYRNVNHVASCARNESNLHLVEYTAQHSETNYRIRFWATLTGPTRLLNMDLTFPEESRTDLDRYSSRLFPNLNSCPR